MTFKDKYPDLEDVQAGSTWVKLFNFIYAIASLRYSTQKQLNKVSSQFGTPKKLEKLRKRDYLTAIRNSDVYVITKKTRQLLKDEGYKTDILQADFNGINLNHQLKITDCLVSLIREDDHYALFYPNFTYLIPDFCLIKKRDDAYKIIFGEVEEEKPNWTDYLNEKREKYNRLAKDRDIYLKWWKVYCEKLGLPYCTEEQFCFSVLVKGNIKKDWEGWNWIA